MYKMDFFPYPIIHNVLIVISTTLLIFSLACDKPESANDNNESVSESYNGNSNSTSVKFVVSVYPLKLILDELTTGRAEVSCFMSPGVSPHTFEPTPSDMIKVFNATAFFWVSENLDGWAVDAETKNKVNVIDLLPTTDYIYFEHNHKDNYEMHDDQVSEHHEFPVDPHFWTSPRTVLAILKPLTEKLIALDPEGTDVYNKNADNFAIELDNLDKEVTRKLNPCRGEYLILLHPSFLYFMRDYKLELAGVVETSPGKEPTPKQILELKNLVKKYKVNALFSEPQLSRQSIDVLVSETDLPLLELDPIGGIDGRTTYRSLIEYNTEILIKAFNSNLVAKK